jgi:hypothetical protein
MLTRKNSEQQMFGANKFLTEFARFRVGVSKRRSERLGKGTVHESDDTGLHGKRR